MKTIKNIIICALLAVLILNPISVNASEHYVARGDSLWKISRSYGVALDKLINANPQIKDPNLIYPGDRVYVPDGKDTAAEKVLELTNANRRASGLKDLKLDAELCRVAQAKADDMAAKGYFSHQSPTYGSPSDMLKAFGVSYRYMGENIAKGYDSAEKVVQGWMNSSGHRANILNGNFTALGVGYNSTAKTWVQIFKGM